MTGFGFAFGIIALITVIETFNIRYAWESDEEKSARDPAGKTNAQLKPDYVNGEYCGGRLSFLDLVVDSFLSFSLCAGDLGFDPLGLKPQDDEAFNAIQTKELNNGRLGAYFMPFLLHPLAKTSCHTPIATDHLAPAAMIGAAGMLVQELVSGKGVAEYLGLEAPLPAAFDTNAI